jgi:predicted DsbA family dithiol-disulfide isomerase
MHDLLLERQDHLLTSDLIRYAGDLGLDTARFRADLARRAGAARIAEDVDTADLSGVSGTPTFFINDRRHYGAYDIAALTDAVRTAKARVVSQKPRSRAT